MLILYVVKSDVTMITYCKVQVQILSAAGSVDNVLLRLAKTYSIEVHTRCPGLSLYRAEFVSAHAPYAFCRGRAEIVKTYLLVCFHLVNGLNNHVFSDHYMKLLSVLT